MTSCSITQMSCLMLVSQLFQSTLNFSPSLAHAQRGHNCSHAAAPCYRAQSIQKAAHRLSSSVCTPPEEIQPRLKFDVYICTTAEYNYACEMWRLLDPGNLIIPADKFEQRLVCVRQVDKGKILSHALHIGEPGDVGSKMPLTLILDDRRDVGYPLSRNRLWSPWCYNPFWLLSGPSSRFSMRFLPCCEHGPIPFEDGDLMGCNFEGCMPFRSSMGWLALTLIALQIWEQTAQAQIAYIEPFQPYRRSADVIEQLGQLGRNPNQIPWLSLCTIWVSHTVLTFGHTLICAVFAFLWMQLHLYRPCCKCTKNL